MSILTLTETALHAIDHAASKAGQGIFKPRPSLMIFIFHGLFMDREEIQKNLIDPQQSVTVEDFRKFAEYFHCRKFNFVSPEDVLKGLDPGRNHIMITFDDGYYNNSRALPVLNEFNIPAVFFITTNNVRDNACFWWDVIYRENLKKGVNVGKISVKERMLKKKTADQIEKHIINKYGRDSFKPVSDVDRPFTASELKEFSKNKYVFLGNHTSDHAILTGYPPGQIHTQIWEAQSYLHNITGKWPDIISYPNGNFSPEVIRISKELGLQLGVTLEEKKNFLPLDKNGTTELGRFFLLGNKDITRQCDILCSNIMLYIRLKNLLKHLL